MPEPEIKTLEVKSVNDKYKEASDKQKAKDKAESFRKDEEKGLSKSMGTAGPKESVDMSSGGDDDKPKVTAKQKEEFREQEDTYRTKSPGTVGDKYYKNPEGTGTGQGGSGIPVEKKESKFKSISAPMDRPDDLGFTYLENFNNDSYSYAVQSTEPIIEPLDDNLIYSTTDNPYETYTPASRRQYPRSQESLLAGTLGAVRLKLKVNLLDRNKTFIQAIEGKVTF